MKTIDVRTIAPIERHPIIFKTFDELKINETFQIVNDHDPKPLLRYFKTERENEFSWEYLEEGPVWRVKIGRVALPDPNDQEEGCCGMCKG